MYAVLARFDFRQHDDFADSPKTYDKTAISALVATLRFLFDLRPNLQVLISGAVRNAETFETFRHACGESMIDCSPTVIQDLADNDTQARSKFNVNEMDFEAMPMREQTALFYATAVPLKILSIKRS